METAQSFGQEFFGEPVKVLLNLLHCFEAFRWCAILRLNHISWLMSVQHDCYIWFLRQNEPMYAYHALKIARFYFDQILLPQHPEATAFTNPHVEMFQLLAKAQEGLQLL